MEISNLLSNFLQWTQICHAHIHKRSVAQSDFPLVLDSHHAFLCHGRPDKLEVHSKLDSQQKQVLVSPKDVRLPICFRQWV